MAADKNFFWHNIIGDEITLGLQRILQLLMQDTMSAIWQIFSYSPFSFNFRCWIPNVQIAIHSFKIVISLTSIFSFYENRYHFIYEREDEFINPSNLSQSGKNIPSTTWLQRLDNIIRFVTKIHTPLCLSPQPMGERKIPPITPESHYDLTLNEKVWTKHT